MWFTISAARLLIFVILLSPRVFAEKSNEGDLGDPEFDKLLAGNTRTSNGIQSLRDEIMSVQSKPTRPKSVEVISEVNLLKETLGKLSPTIGLSFNLTKMLEMTPGKETVASPRLSKSAEFDAYDAITEHSINVIDSHVTHIVNEAGMKSMLELNLDEMQDLHQQSAFNMYRENLKIDSIHEDVSFTLGKGVEQWKVLVIDGHSETVLIGRKLNQILIAVGHNGSYEMKQEINFDVSEDGNRLQIETMKLWDKNINDVRYLVLVANNGQLIWFEFKSDELREIHRWNLMKKINSMIHFPHNGNELLLVSTSDDTDRTQIEFIEFNVPDEEFWMVQAFTLPSKPSSMACMEIGRDQIVAFTQGNHVSFYRYQYNHNDERGKFVWFKNISAANASVVSGFRIGGHSYLAIGGDHPQILRFFNGDFHQQTILSQTFGRVEEYLPIPIRTYRDDLVLLVQHRLQFRTHTLAVVEALIWNGLAFDNALSVPCHVTADPNANGLTCMLDLERDDGFLGSAFIHYEKSEDLYVIIPRHEAHSGLFRIHCSIVEIEDPLMKEMEQLKSSIELINKMLDFEAMVQKEAEEALQLTVDPRNDFSFDSLHGIDEIETELLELDGKIELESDVIEFEDTFWTHEDFKINLDDIERTIEADEEKLRRLDEELNQLIRINRQVQNHPSTNNQQSDIYHMGSFPFNGQLDPRTIQVIASQNNGQRRTRQIKPIDESRVSTLSVKNLNVATINGIPTSELMFLEDGKLLVPESIVTFQDSIKTNIVIMENDGRVNDIDFDREILMIENSPSDLIMETVIAENLEASQFNSIPVDIESLQTIDALVDKNLQNLTAKIVIMRDSLNIETINGISWNEFVSKLVPKHKSSSIDELIVDGDIIVGEFGELAVNTLNGISFPDGFVLSTGPRESVITGKKTFIGALGTNAIDTDGQIDGIEPSNIVTLDQDQYIPAQTTFKVLEVAKRLEVNGTIAGRQLTEFLPNPTLEEVNEIAASCSFRELIVEGTVLIEHSLNGQNLEKVLDDVVYDEDGAEVIIPSSKSFRNLEASGDIKIASNFINDQQLNNFMMSDRDQNVKVPRLSGQLLINNLKLSGLFDGINATDLEINSVRTFGDQFVESEIIFASNHQVGANSLDVKQSLNEVPVSDFMFIDQLINFSVTDDVVFNELKVEKLQIDGDITGPGKLININLDDFSKTYLSKSLRQNILTPVKIGVLFTNSTFHSERINGIDMAMFKKYMKTLRNFKNLVLTGDQKLDTMIIEGNVNVKTINDHDFQKMIDDAIWLNRPNNIDTMKFIDDIQISGGLMVQGFVNRRAFIKWIENWISINENPITVKMDKVLNGHVTVTENLETEMLNKIKYTDLLMLDDLDGLPMLVIGGNLNVHNLTVNGTLNRNMVKELNDKYSYNEETNVHTIEADIHFNQQANVNYLNATTVNQNNINDWMNNLIRSNDNNVFVYSNKTFKNQFIAQRGFWSEKLNNVDLSFLERAILIDEPVRVIHDDIVFEDAVYARSVAVSKDLSTHFISGCDPLHWLHGLRINQNISIIPEIRMVSKNFKPSNLTAQSLNGVSFGDYITLHTDQHFQRSLIVDGPLRVSEPLSVKGFVNDLDLESERENTVMRTGSEHQVVSCKTSFVHGHVFESLTISGLVNSKELQNIVLLNSSATIKSPINIRSLQGQTLITNDTISSVRFDKWYEEVLWANGKHNQTVTGTWKVDQIQLHDNVHGNGLINGFSISEIEQNLKANIASIDSVISNHYGSYQKLCSNLQYIANQTSDTSSYILKHFELDFKLQGSSPIFSQFAFKTFERHFLAINTNCTTQLYVWHKEARNFIKVDEVITGVVYHWTMVKNAQQDLFIVTNSKMEAHFPCPIGGLNVWKLNENNLVHIKTILPISDVVELHANDEQLGIFYVLKNLDQVVKFDLFGNQLESWKLPSESYNYNFLSNDVSNGLTLSSGRKLFMLDSKAKSRQTRTIGIFSDSPVMEVFKNQTKPGDSKIYSMRMPPTDLKIKKQTIPEIPATPLKNVNEKPNVFSKLRDFGEAFKTLNLKKLPKLSIRNQTDDASSRSTEKKLDENNYKSSTDKSLIEKISDMLQPKDDEKVSTTSEPEIIPKDRNESAKNVSDADKLKNIVNDIKQLFSNSEDAHVEDVPIKMESSTAKASFDVPTPRILMPHDTEEEDVSSLNNVEEPSTKFPEDVTSYIEPNADDVQIGNEQLPILVISGNGVTEMENIFFPERGAGEIIVLYVGPSHQKRPLYAVWRTRDSIIKGNHNLVEIYNDIYEGTIYQYIHCTDPSNLVALQFRDETLLAFLEGKTEVHIYTYKGFQGFVPFGKIKLPGYAQQMTTVTLPAKENYKCPHHYLVVRMETEIIFLRMKISGNCGLSNIHCDEY